MEMCGLTLDQMPEETDPALDRVIEADGLLEANGAWPREIPQIFDNTLDVLGTSV
jgi:hypothetical protein